MLRPFFCCFLLICAWVAAEEQAVDSIQIFIRDDVYEDYLKFLKGRDVLTINDFDSKNMRRDVADMVVLQQALAIGGFDKNFHYLPGKVNFRNTRMLESGELLLSFDTYWLNDAKRLGSKVLVSDEVIRKGEYLAGIYASPNNKAVFQIKQLADLSQFTAVSTPKWTTDWQTISALPLKKLIREDEWLSQARMVHLQWVDFMLMPFVNSADGVYRLEQIRLQVVPGVAILLNDSRHFVVSNQHPDGPRAFAALNIGLKQLRTSGKITKMYQQAGFLVDARQYQVLNTPTDLSNKNHSSSR